MSDITKMSELRERVNPTAVTMAPLGALAGLVALGELLYRGGDPQVRQQLLEEVRGAGVDFEAVEGPIKSLGTSVGPGESGRTVLRAGTDAHPAVIAHEMGHMTRGPLRKALEAVDPAVPLLRRSASTVYGAGLLPLLSGLLTGRAWNVANDDDLDTDEKIKKLRGNQVLNAISTLPYAPTLIEEARASGHAVHRLSKMQGPKAGAGAALRLAPAFGTYAATLGFPAMAALYVQGLKKSIREDALEKLARADIPRHAQQRAKERTKVSPVEVAKLQRRVMKMKLDKGQTYYHQWPQGGYSVVAPTHLGRSHRVKTTLAPHMRPPGVMLPR